MKIRKTSMRSTIMDSTSDGGACCGISNEEFATLNKSLQLQSPRALFFFPPPFLDRPILYQQKTALISGPQILFRQAGDLNKNAAAATLQETSTTRQPVRIFS